WRALASHSTMTGIFTLPLRRSSGSLKTSRYLRAMPSGPPGSSPSSSSEASPASGGR
ncbi:MAG: hypothetical protein AVDCRST_MAG85-2179, partial [uncultured Solirubrobacteraceae bacterium]